MKAAVGRLFCALAIIAAMAAAARAQETTTGSIGGQVIDEQGGVLPGVSVTVTAGQGSQTFVTDAQGNLRSMSPCAASVRMNKSRLTSKAGSSSNRLRGLRRVRESGPATSFSR